MDGGHRKLILPRGLAGPSAFVQDDLLKRISNLLIINHIHICIKHHAEQRFLKKYHSPGAVLHETRLVERYELLAGKSPDQV